MPELGDIIGYRKVPCKKCKALIQFDYFLVKCPNCGAPMTANPRKKEGESGGSSDEQVDTAV